MNRGSEWGRWDLHVHTKDTAKNDQFGNITFDEYCTELFKAALDNDIKVIGITDYFSIENYERVKEFQDKIYSNMTFSQAEASLIKKITLLPNMELRITPTTGKDKSVNIHIIFNPNIIEEFKNSFLPKVEMTFDKDNKFNLTRHGLVSLGRYSDLQAVEETTAYLTGIRACIIDYTSIIDVIHDNQILSSNCLIFVSNNSTDGVSGVEDHEGDMKPLMRSIYRISNGLFSAKPSDRLYFTGKKSDTPEKIIELYGSLKPCIHGCDAHELSKLFKPDLDRYCWIKAEPTFDGLKQIMYEPQTRVYIGSNRPEQKLEYEVIDRIEMNHDNISNNVIYFNPNLNTIVGGRSSGKSTLVQCIANKVAKTALKGGKPDDHVKEISDTMRIIWRDGKEDDSRSVDYFYQGHMYHKAEKEGVEDIVKSILLQSNVQLYENVDKNSAILKQDNAGLLSKIFSYIKIIASKREQIKNIGNKADITDQIEKLNELISKSNIHNYSANDIHAYEEMEVRLKGLNNSLSDVQKAIEEISKLSIDQALSFHQPLLNMPYYQDIKQLLENKLSVIEEVATKQIKDFQEEATSLLLCAKDSLISQIVEITGNKEFDAIQKHLKDADSLKPMIDQKSGESKKLEQIILLEKEIKIEILNFKKNYCTIVKNWKKLNKEAEGLVKALNVQTDSNLVIDPVSKFKSSEFTEFFTKYINQQSEKAQSYAYSKYVDINELFHGFKEIRTSLKNKAIKLKSNFTEESFMSEFLTTDWFKVNYDVLYEGDNYVEMSQGKKAFVVLKLSLECSDRKCPIIIDQPEDDLDNRAIYTELVAYIKEKKAQRQIILVTHNANVVVNADSEQIIVANQHGSKTPNKNNKKFEYKFGSIESSESSTSPNASILESKTIKEHICEILEGGDIAFKLREQKYDL